MPVLSLIYATFHAKICPNPSEILFDDIFDDLQNLSFLTLCTYKFLDIVFKVLTL